MKRKRKNSSTSKNNQPPSKKRKLNNNKNGIPRQIQDVRFHVQTHIVKLLRGKKYKSLLFMGRIHQFLHTPKQVQKRNELGSTSGLPNITIFNAIGGFHGLHILLITTPIPKEYKVLARLKMIGYAVACIQATPMKRKKGKKYISPATMAMKVVKAYMNSKYTIDPKLEIILKKYSKSNAVRVLNKVKIHKKRRNRLYAEYKLHVNSVIYSKEKFTNGMDLIYDSQIAGNTTRYYGYISKLAGYLLSVGDLILWTPNKKYNGLIVEFKYKNNNIIKGGGQETLGKKCKKLGYQYLQCNSIEEYHDIVATHLNDMIST